MANTQISLDIYEILFSPLAKLADNSPDYTDSNKVKGFGILKEEKALVLILSSFSP